MNRWLRDVLCRHRLPALVVLAALCLWTWAAVMYGPYGWLAYRQERAELARWREAIAQLKQQNAALERHVGGLQNDPEVIEDEARKHRYVKPHDQVYVLPERPGEAADSRGPTAALLMQPGEPAPAASPRILWIWLGAALAAFAGFSRWRRTRLKSTCHRRTTTAAPDK